MVDRDAVHRLIHSDEWKGLTDQERYVALRAIDEDAEVYEVSYCPGRKNPNGQYTKEEYASLDEALTRAQAVYSSTLYAGTYVVVQDGGGEEYFTAYAI